MAVYLDCNATSPLDPEVRDAVIHWFANEIGNSGSRTHEFGHRAKNAINQARERVAAVVACSQDEVIFTSGATESNNIALLGLAEYGERTGRRHLVSTAIEHKAVLEPLQILSMRGFEVTLLPVDRGGTLDPGSVLRVLRDDTLCVSIMHVNNETGVEQPIGEVADLLQGNEAFLHIDAAQGFGKIIEPLRHPRIDMMSISSHKIYGPIGVGALITRKRGHKRLPLRPLQFGGGQERGLRPGTLPTPLIVGLGMAAETALRDHDQRSRICRAMKEKAVMALGRLDIRLHGDPERALPHVINFSVPGADSEAVIVALKGFAALSNGSACTSQSYEPSHVLKAMGLSHEECEGAVRMSWCHMTPKVDWDAMVDRISALV